MKTEGVAVQIGNFSQFIGKITIAPHHPQVNGLRGALIFYREWNEEDQVSSKYNAMSIDKVAADYALSRRVNLFVFYAVDTRTMFIAHAEDVANSEAHDLGRGEQYRIPLDKMGILKNTTGLQTHYTQNVTLLGIPDPEVQRGDANQPLLL